jgi:hypothetical protein
MLLDRSRGSVARFREFLRELDKITLFGDKDKYSKAEIRANAVAVNKLCKSELDYLRQHIDLTTLRRYRSDYRNAIRQHYKGTPLAVTYADKVNHGAPTHIAVKYFNLKRSEKEEYARHESARKEVFLLGNRLIIVEPQQLIQVATGLLESSDDFELAAGVLALTGRRPVEVFKTGRFELIGEVIKVNSLKFSPSNSVIFSGQAKTRESQHARDHFPIFTLASPKLVCEALQRLRAKRDFTQFDERQVNSRTSGRLGLAVRRHFDAFVKVCVEGDVENLRDYGYIEAKNLRSMYAHIAQAKFAPLSVITSFATELLGHAKNATGGGNATADNYMEFVLVPAEAGKLL